MILLITLSRVLQAPAQGISVSPSRFFFTGSAGTRVTQSLSLANPSKHRVTFRLLLKDFYRDSLGEKIYSDPGTTPGSNASWVDGLPSTVELAPGEKKDLPVYLSIPADSSSQKAVSRSMLFLSQVGNTDTIVGPHGGRNMGIQVRLEVGIHIYYTPSADNRRSLEFLAFDDRGRIPVGKDTVRRYALRVHNGGDVSADATVRLELTDKSTGREIPIPEKKITLLPDTEQIVYLDLPILRGQYLAVAFLDTGDQNDLKVAEKDIVY